MCNQTKANKKIKNTLMPTQILRDPRGNICDNMMFNITQCFG
jgi:hypothetical protein